MKRRNIDEIPYIEFKYRVFRITSMCDRSRMCMIKIFRGGKGWWMGWGVAVKDA